MDNERHLRSLRRKKKINFNFFSTHFGIKDSSPDSRQKI